MKSKEKPVIDLPRKTSTDVNVSPEPTKEVVVQPDPGFQVIRGNIDILMIRMLEAINNNLVKLIEISQEKK